LANILPSAALPISHGTGRRKGKAGGKRSKEKEEEEEEEKGRKGKEERD
jgi:hypothetical protein